MSVRPPGQKAQQVEGARKTGLRKGGGAYEGGLQAALAVVISAGLGIWADSYFDTSPVGLFLGIGIGFGAFILRIWQLLQAQSSTEQDSEEGPQGGDAG